MRGLAISDESHVDLSATFGHQTTAARLHGPSLWAGTGGHLSVDPTAQQLIIQVTLTASSNVNLHNRWRHTSVTSHKYSFLHSWRLTQFLLLARYVPNVAKRSIWDQCKKKYILRTDRQPTNDRPTSHLAIGEISNGHISARGRPIHFMFGSAVGFSGSADRMALIPFWPSSIGMWEKTMRDE